MIAAVKVLVVEDSERLRYSLGQALRKSGYAVDLVGDGREGFDYAYFNSYDVVVLDLLLPNLDGLTALKRLRQAGRDVPILILSAMDRVEDRVRGLELGADDYLIKPFSFEELHARLRTLMRRRSAARLPTLQIGPVAIDTVSKTVRAKEGEIPLTAGEYAILETLARQRGRILSKERLLDSAHDSDSYPGLNVIEVMVCKIRSKLKAVAGDGLIRTRRGHGYYLEGESED